MRTARDLFSSHLLRELDSETAPAPAGPGRNAEVEPRRERVRTIWLSDLHLGTRGCRAADLIAFLKRHECETLYLVGDVIDGWRLKAGIFWPQSHTDVIRRILTQAKRGARVVVVTGNHDEFLRRYTEVEFGNIAICDEAEHRTADGRRLLVIHGDQYDGVVQAHRWLAFLGDKGYTLLLVANHWFNRFRERFGYPYWSLSAHIKGKVKSAVNFIYQFEHAVAWDCQRRGFDGVVCGHIHHAEIREVDGVAYHNCGDWVESCTALIERYDGSIEICPWVTADHDRAREADAARAECG
ncbi:MAG: UDP-2,3-diacylglucosamine diphosphatase [Halofilum sp. (in: g-proteobacteria)]